MRRWLAAGVAAVVVCGIAAEAGVKFKGYTAAGESYIEVLVTGDDGTPQTCPSGDAGTLWPQYNLASVLVPGLSPLAYENNTDGAYDPEANWLDPLATAANQGSNGLPEWWNKRGGNGRAYRLRPAAADGSDGPLDSLLATGLFIPEVELDGDFWWPTTKNGQKDQFNNDGYYEPASVNTNRVDAKTDTVCRSHPRPTVEPRGGFDKVFADLEVVQDVLLRNVDAAPDHDNIFEQDNSTLVTVDSIHECNVPPAGTDPQKPLTSTLGNLTGYKYAPTGAVNLRLYKEANSVAAPFLRQLPLGATRLEDGSVNPRTNSQSPTFRKRTVQNMKRYPGMAPIVAPWGPAAAAHRSPGRPFFECAARRPPPVALGGGGRLLSPFRGI